MLTQRITTAIVLLGIVFILLFKVNNNTYICMATLICTFTFYELLKMYGINLKVQIFSIILFIGFCLGISLVKYDFNNIISFLILLNWCLIVPLLLIWHPKSFPHFIIIGLGFIFFIPSFYVLCKFKFIFGAMELLSIMAIAWISDIAGYFVGKRYGKHKLAYLISPNKTIEGALAGFSAVIIYMLILKNFHLVSYLHNYVVTFKYALLFTTVGIIGDLMESLFKRVAKVKDSSKLLPGHGGLYDRLDSLLAIISVAYVLIVFNN